MTSIIKENKNNVEIIIKPFLYRCNKPNKIFTIKLNKPN